MVRCILVGCILVGCILLGNIPDTSTSYMDAFYPAPSPSLPSLLPFPIITMWPWPSTLLFTPTAAAAAATRARARCTSGVETTWAMSLLCSNCISFGCQPTDGKASRNARTYFVYFFCPHPLTLCIITRIIRLLVPTASLEKTLFCQPQLLFRPKKPVILMQYIQYFARPQFHHFVEMLKLRAIQTIFDPNF